mgnify:CR=1 FL=1
MKVEGTPEEIKDFVQTENFSATEFFKPEALSIHNKWVIIPAAIFIVCIIINIFCPTPDKWSLLINVIGICSACWLAFSSQIAWKQMIITGLIPVFAIIILMLSSSQITMAEAMEKFDKYTEECDK